MLVNIQYIGYVVSPVTYNTVQKFGAVFYSIIFKESITFIQQGCIITKYVRLKKLSSFHKNSNQHNHIFVFLNKCFYEN